MNIRKPGNNPPAKALALLLCLLFPITALCEYCGLAQPGALSLNTMWCGLYGCILAGLFWRSMPMKAAVIVANIVPFGFLCLGFLMGGAMGPVYLLLRAAIPFIPWTAIL